MSAASPVARWAGSWRAALRISRREVLRHRARNILIVAMLALPVFGATAVQTILNSSQNLSVQEQTTRVVGGTDAYIFPMVGWPVYESASIPPGSVPAASARATAYGSNPPSPSEAQLASDAPVQKILPQATLLQQFVTWNVYVHGPSGYATPAYYQLDFADPALGGAFDLLSGRLPNAADEVDISPRTASALGVQVGGTITLPATSTKDGLAHSFDVVGIMRRPDGTTAQDVFAPPTAAAAANEAPDGWFVLNPGGVTWNQVKQLNAAGYVAESRDVALDPPPASQVPYDAQSIPPRFDPVTAASAAVVGIVVGIVLLEVILLAGPAFAVSARRREREYAMLGATGADSRQIRRIVLADGLVLGAAAGVFGALAGFGAAAAMLPFVAAHTGSLPGHVHVDLLRVLGVIVLAMLLGLCSALVPAHGAAKRNIMATLAGRRLADSRRRRVGRTVLGLILIPVGLYLVMYAKQISAMAPQLYAVGGIALIEVGAILCTTTVVRLVAKAGRILPLGPRLALRDSARHTGRTTPAVAAMFVAVAGAVAAGAWFESSVTQARDIYQPALLPNQVAVASVTGARQAGQIEAKLATVLPIDGSTLSQETAVQNGNSSGTDLWTVGVVDTAEPGGIAPFWGYSLESDVVGGPAALREVTGISNAQADEALDRGGVVVFTPGVVKDGQLTLVRAHTYLTENGKGPQRTDITRVTLPAAYVDAAGRPDPGMVISPSGAAKVALPGAVVPPNLLLDLKTHITATQSYAANQILVGLGVQSGLTAEDGFQSELGLANVIVLIFAVMLAIGAAAIATGLALADGRADQETLTAVGGSPWTRRWLAGSTALVITGLGVLIGVPVGFAIAGGLVRVSNLAVLMPSLGTASQPSMPLAVPWLDLGVMVLGLPAVTALTAALLSRSRTPRAGRIEF